MEKQKNSDIEIAVKFEGVPAELLPDFEFEFYSEWHQTPNVVICSKTGNELVNCVVVEPPLEQRPPGWGTVVRCILENHNFKPGRLCVKAHIKWPDPSYKDGVRNDVYREKLDLVITK